MQTTKAINIMFDRNRLTKSFIFFICSSFENTLTVPLTALFGQIFPFWREKKAICFLQYFIFFCKNFLNIASQFADEFLLGILLTCSGISFILNHLFISSFIHLFIYSFIHLFIYSFIHQSDILLIHPISLFKSMTCKSLIYKTSQINIIPTCFDFTFLKITNSNLFFSI